MSIQGWITCLILAALMLFGPYYVKDSSNPWLKSSFATMSHTLWSIVLMWICFASVSGIGGSEYYLYFSLILICV